MDDKEIEAQVDAAAAGEKAAMQDTMAQAAPQAVETLQGNRLTALSEAVTAAAEFLSGGQIQAAPMDYAEDQDQVPADLFAQVAALAALASQIPEGEAYAFDPAELLVDNAGLAELGSIIGKMGSDKALKRALANGMEPDAAPEETEETPDDDDDLDEYM